MQLSLVCVFQMRQEEELNFLSSCEKKHVELLASIQDLESKVDHSKESNDHKAEVENTLQRDCQKLKVLRGVKQLMYLRTESRIKTSHS